MGEVPMVERKRLRAAKALESVDVGCLGDERISPRLNIGHIDGEGRTRCSTKADAILEKVHVRNGEAIRSRSLSNDGQIDAGFESCAIYGIGNRDGGRQVRRGNRKD